MKKKVLELAFSGKLTGEDVGEWESVRLGDVTEIVWKRGSGLNKLLLNSSGRNKCILYGELFTKYNEHIIMEIVSRTNAVENSLSRVGDILIPGTSTAAKSEIIRARVVMFDDVLIGGDINILHQVQEVFSPKYLAYFFDSRQCKEQLVKFVTGTTGIIHLSNTGIKNAIVPLPPLVTQRRIVAKIDEIFEVLDSLSLSLRRLLGEKESN
jgi:type I restriction enzyme S subunit